MKIVHINTTTRGGAWKACVNLHLSLLDQGVESILLTKYPNLDKEVPKHFSWYSLDDVNPPLQLKNYFIDKVTKKYSRLLHGDPQIKPLKERNKVDKLGIEIISSPYSNVDLSKSSYVRKADLVNLHWVANFVDSPTFFKNIGKPIVWTLHDLNPISGIFHYEHKEHLPLNFHLLNEKFRKKKKKYYDKHDCILPVTLSKWLMSEVRESNFFSRRPQLIVNSIDLSLFKPYDKQFAKAIFNLDPTKKTILFVSEKLDNPRKGLTVLIEALRNSARRSVNILVVGSVDTRIKATLPGANFTEYINDDRLLALAYSAADLFVLPSLQDNLPNTMLESMACGTPVLSFPVGGMLDTIVPEKNGFFAQEINSKSLCDSILKFLKGEIRFERKQIREFAVKYFSPKSQANKYLSVYNSMLQ